MNHFEKGLWSGGHLVCWYYVLLSLRDPRVQAPFAKWNDKMSFVYIGTMLLRNVVLQSHLRRLPWRRMPINIKTHFYFTRAHFDSPGDPLDEKYIYDSFWCPPAINLFSKLYRHSKDTWKSRCELLHIWKPKYSCKVKGLPGLWAEDIYHKTDYEW